MWYYAFSDISENSDSIREQNIKYREKREQEGSNAKWLVENRTIGDFEHQRAFYTLATYSPCKKR